MTHLSDEISGLVAAKDGSQVALASAADRFIVVDAATLGSDLQIGDRQSLHFSQDRPFVERGRSLTM